MHVSQVLFLSMIAGWMNRKQQAVIEYLLEENRVLKDQLAGKRLSLTDEIRRKLAIKGKAIGWANLMKYATLVRPETILKWHRKLVAMKYNFAYRRQPKGTISEETKKLALRMARENPTWGYLRIQGALKNLRHEIGKTSLVRLLRDVGLSPTPERTRVSWSTFLKRHWSMLAAADFFAVEVWTPRGLVRYFVWFVMDLATREVKIVHISCQWNGEVMKQLARNLLSEDNGIFKGKRWLIIDRDPLYTEGFRDLLKAGGITPLRLPPHAYVMNHHAERFVHSIRSECLDHLIFFGERSLRHAVLEFEAHYNRERNHQGIGNTIIHPDPQVFDGEGAVRCAERLGGLLNFYRREAVA